MSFVTLAAFRVIFCVGRFLARSGSDDSRVFPDVDDDDGGDE